MPAVRSSKRAAHRTLQWRHQYGISQKGEMEPGGSEEEYGDEELIDVDIDNVANGTTIASLPGWSLAGLPSLAEVRDGEFKIQTLLAGQGVEQTVSGLDTSKTYRLQANYRGDGLSSIVLSPGGVEINATGPIDQVVSISAAVTTLTLRVNGNVAGLGFYRSLSLRKIL